MQGTYPYVQTRRLLELVPHWPESLEWIPRDVGYRQSRYAQTSTWRCMNYIEWRVGSWLRWVSQRTWRSLRLVCVKRIPWMCPCWWMRWLRARSPQQPYSLFAECRQIDVPVSWWRICTYDSLGCRWYWWGTTMSMMMLVVVQPTYPFWAHIWWMLPPSKYPCSMMCSCWVQISTPIPVNVYS